MTSKEELKPTVFTLFLDSPIYRKIIIDGREGYSQLCDSITVELKNNEKQLYGIYGNSARAPWNNNSKEFEYESLPSNRSEDFLKDTRFTLEEANKIIEEILSLYNISREQFLEKKT